MANSAETAAKGKLISYRYVGADGQGKAVKGTIKAANEYEAERFITGQGYLPISIEVTPSMFSLEEALPTLFKIKPEDVIVFSRQLATLLRSGISLLPALDTLQGQVASGRAFRKIISVIINDLGTGSTLSQAISKHPKAFNDIYCRTIAVGERSGNLETVLNSMAEYYEKQGIIMKKITRALTYPVMLLVLGAIVVVILMTVVMPQMLGMFTAMNVELPLPTRILVIVTNLFNDNILYLVIGGAFLGAALLWMMKQPAGRRVLDRVRLNFPLIGMPILLGELARLSRTMSVLVSAGVSLQEIMDVVPQSTSNTVIRDSLLHVKEGLLLGEGLSAPMSSIDLFPPLMVQMVAVGEESNTLDFTMGVVADFYESTAEQRMTAVVGMLGPMTTAVIAIGVGFIALAIVMPIYSLTGAIG
ncbi:type II secretion system F family protein [Chloroflexota bacterium]